MTPKVKRMVVLAIITVIIAASISIAWYMLSAPRVPTRVRWATCTTGGAIWYMAASYAKVVKEHYPDIEVVVEATGCSTDNLDLLEAGKVEMIHGISDIFYERYRGIGRWQGRPMAGLRVLTYELPTITHTFTLNPSIKTMSDLAGKSVRTGAPGSGEEAVIMKMLDALGLKDKIIPLRVGPREAISALRDGRVDVVIMQTTVPNAAVLELYATPGIRVYSISLTPDEVKKIHDKHPFLVEWVIEPNTYKGQPERILTTANPCGIFVRLDMPEDLAYRLVSVIFDHHDELAPTHELWAALTIDKATIISGIPYHPGAIRYFKEKGVWKE